MTYSGHISPESKSEAENRIKSAVEEALANLTIEASYNPESETWESVIALENSDLYKLMSIMNYSSRISTVNDNPTSRLIIGSIETINPDNPLQYTLGKICYARESVGTQVTLQEGCLIIPDAKYPAYATLQTDDIYRAGTIGKIVDLSDKYIYIDQTGEVRTKGEYELSRVKKLNLNTDPTLVKKSSRTSQVPTPKSFSNLTRRPSCSSATSAERIGSNLSSRSLQPVPESPRTIHRFRLVRYM